MHTLFTLYLDKRVLLKVVYRHYKLHRVLFSWMACAAKTSDQYINPLILDVEMAKPQYKQ